MTADGPVDNDTVVKGIEEIEKIKKVENDSKVTEWSAAVEVQSFFPPACGVVADGHI